ncbi:MAG TPA: hypothetical protein VHO69_01215 [Phototrophicaceae bacterium]|nr:hypothetical protein [Phototrophicaceae bacterium]
MPAIANFRSALNELQIDETIVAQIMEGYEKISDSSKKELRAAFFVQAIARLDALLPPETAQAVRDACACSKGGWRLKEVEKVARNTAGKSLEEKIQTLRGVTHMGQPTLNEDGTITAGIGDEGGLQCPCPVFDGLEVRQPPAITYCYCCAGHFRYHYQIALGKKLVTKSVVSSALVSHGEKPCRFVYEIVE